MSESPKKLAEKHKNFGFEKHYRLEHRPRIRTRLLALHHLTQGMTQKDAATAALCNEISIRRWIRAFDEKGLAGLEENPGRGRKRKLPEVSEEEFVADVEKLQAERKGGRVIAKDVQKLLLEKYGVLYELNSLYGVLARFNFSWVSCRSRHPKRSQEAIGEFKSSFSDVVGEIKKK